MTHPKVFISYARADGESAVKDFWAILQEFLKTPDRRWDKWDDKEILVGQEWDNIITQALEQGCNCCLLLVSDLFAKSSYIIDKEWPKTLARYEEQGMIFFPVVFGVLEGGLPALPEKLRQFQVYWPSVAELYVPPPVNIATPDRVYQCYKDAKEKDAVRDRFLSRLAKEMNARFDEHLRDIATKSRSTSLTSLQANIGQFISSTSSDEAFARAIFGSFSYEKRYRDSHSKDRYFPRQVDVKLDERLLQGNWVLVEGHPLAGKTRAVFEAIKRLMLTGRSIALWPFKAPEKTDQPLALPMFPKADYRIVWMDDIDTRFRDLVKQGYGTNEINQFLEHIADAGIILAATARTGPTYYNFRHRFGLNDHLWDKLESFPIHRLEGEEERGFTEWYSAHFGASLPDEFDHHPGSLFLNLETMGDRWRNMDNIANEHKLKLDVERVKDIMRALHVFYVMEAYRPGDLFLEEDIRFYLRHKAEKRRMMTPMGMAIARTQLLYQLPGGEEWDTLIEFLSQDKFHLGFLRREGEYLLTETAYLDYIVAPDGEKNIAQTIVEYFSVEERLKLGLMVTSYNFGEVFRDSPPKNEKEIQKLVRKLKPLGLEREISVWNQLLELCPTFLLAQRAMELLGKVGLNPNLETYNVLITKAPDDATVLAIMDQMVAADVIPKRGIYNRLITNAQNHAIARAIMDSMAEAGVSPDISTYNYLIANAQDYDTARAIMDSMAEAGISPDIGIYNKLIAKADDYATANTILNEMVVARIPLRVGTYNILITKVHAYDYDTAKAILKEMAEARVTANRDTYKYLIANAQDYTTARALVNEMTTARIRLTRGIYHKLIIKAPDHATACAIMNEMVAAGIPPTDSISDAVAVKEQDQVT